MHTLVCSHSRAHTEQLCASVCVHPDPAGAHTRTRSHVHTCNTHTCVHTRRTLERRLQRRCPRAPTRPLHVAETRTPTSDHPVSHGPSGCAGGSRGPSGRRTGPPLFHALFCRAPPPPGVLPSGTGPASSFLPGPGSASAASADTPASGVCTELVSHSPFVLRLLPYSGVATVTVRRAHASSLPWPPPHGAVIASALLLSWRPPCTRPAAHTLGDAHTLGAAHTFGGRPGRQTVLSLPFPALLSARSLSLPQASQSHGAQRHDLGSPNSPHSLAAAQEAGTDRSRSLVATGGLHLPLELPVSPRRPLSLPVSEHPVL